MTPKELREQRAVVAAVEAAGGEALYKDEPATGRWLTIRRALLGDDYGRQFWGVRISVMRVTPQLLDQFKTYRHMELLFLTGCKTHPEDDGIDEALPGVWVWRTPCGT